MLRVLHTTENMAWGAPSTEGMFLRKGYVLVVLDYFLFPVVVLMALGRSVSSVLNSPLSLLSLFVSALDEVLHKLYLGCSQAVGCDGCNEGTWVPL